MTDPRLQICEQWVLTFAARHDAYQAWVGGPDGHWIAVRADLTGAVLLKAIEHREPLGGYMIATDHTSHIGALDIDRDNGREMAFRIAHVMADMGATAYIEPSARGAHLWWPLRDPAPARQIRHAFRHFIAEAGYPPSDPKIELRPGGDQCNGLGHPLRLPTLFHGRTRKRYPLLTIEGKPVAESMGAIILALAETPPDVVAEAAMRAPVIPGDLHPMLRPPRRWRDDDDMLVSDVLAQRWGVVPKASSGVSKACRCPAHDDRHASLMVLPDDKRAICQAPECLLHNNGKGWSARELLTIAV